MTDLSQPPMSPEEKERNAPFIGEAFHEMIGSGQNAFSTPAGERFVEATMLRYRAQPIDYRLAVETKEGILEPSALGRAFMATLATPDIVWSATEAWPALVAVANRAGELSMGSPPARRRPGL